MSYILEALKKAQAERQLGNAPTVHAPVPSYAAAGASDARRWPWMVGAVLAGAVLAAGLLWWLRAPDSVAPVAAPAARSAPAAANAPAPAVAAAPVPVPRPPVVVAPSPPVAAVVAPRATPVPVSAPDPVPVPVPVPVPAPAPAPAPAPVNSDDALPLFMQLAPEVQRSIPRVVFGGYIYSPDPAERLLLVDNVLRHEGEEVAAGLVLERLLPKSAILNYRGLRYRVAY